MANTAIPTDSQLAQLRQIEAPEKDVLIVSIDLLSELTEALGTAIEPLVNNSKLMQLIFFCANVTLKILKRIFIHVRFSGY